jgi:hypothetical protein
MQNVHEKSAVKGIAIERLAWVRQFTTGLLDGLADEQLAVRAGGAGNHA